MMDPRTAEMIGTHNIFAGLWRNLSEFTDRVPCWATRKILLSVLHAIRKSARIIRERVPAELRPKLYTPWYGGHEEPAERHLDAGLDPAEARWVRDVLYEAYRIVHDVYETVHGMWLRERVEEAGIRTVASLSAFAPVFAEAMA